MHQLQQLQLQPHQHPQQPPSRRRDLLPLRSPDPTHPHHLAAQHPPQQQPAERASGLERIFSRISVALTSFELCKLFETFVDRMKPL